MGEGARKLVSLDQAAPAILWRDACHGDSAFHGKTHPVIGQVREAGSGHTLADEDPQARATALGSLHLFKRAFTHRDVERTCFAQDHFGSLCAGGKCARKQALGHRQKRFRIRPAGGRGGSVFGVLCHGHRL